MYRPATAFDIYKDHILPPSLTVLLFNPSLIPPVTRPTRSRYIPTFPLPTTAASIGLTTAEDPGDMRLEARILDSLDLPLYLRCLSASATVTRHLDYIVLAEIRAISLISYRPPACRRTITNLNRSARRCPAIVGSVRYDYGQSKKCCTAIWPAAA
jgi:hypothetical protein